MLKLGVSKNRGVSPKMDGENNGIFPIKMDDLGGFHPLFSENIHIGNYTIVQLIMRLYHPVVYGDLTWEAIVWFFRF